MLGEAKGEVLPGFTDSSCRGRARYGHSEQISRNRASGGLSAWLGENQAATLLARGTAGLKAALTEKAARLAMPEGAELLLTGSCTSGARAETPIPDDQSHASAGKGCPLGGAAVGGWESSNWSCNLGGARKWCSAVLFYSLARPTLMLSRSNSVIQIMHD